MSLERLLAEKKMSVYQCAKQSGIPYTTLLELVKGKTRIAKCSAETVYKLAKTLEISMEELLEQAGGIENRVSFETFKSNICHIVKTKGDIEFIIDTLEKDEVCKYWERKWYPEAYYTLAMVDYLSRLNHLPLCQNYNDIRNTSLKEPLFPRDISLAAKMDNTLDIREQAIKEAIPEFIRLNIVEKEIRNVC